MEKNLGDSSSKASLISIYEQDKKDAEDTKIVNTLALETELETIQEVRKNNIQNKIDMEDIIKENKDEGEEDFEEIMLKTIDEKIVELKALMNPWIYDIDKRVMILETTTHNKFISIN